MATRRAPAPQLDLFAVMERGASVAEPAPEPVAPAVPQAPDDLLEVLLHQLIHAMGMQAAEAPWHLYTRGGALDLPRCARLVNLIVRRVASDRPVLTTGRVELAIALLPGWWQDVRRDAGADRRVWALVRGEVDS